MHAPMVNGNNKFVYGGTCDDNRDADDFKRFCALDATACPSLVDWNDFQVSKNVWGAGSTGCITRSGTNQIKIGRCSGDDRPFCTSVKEACKEPSGFDKEHPDCTIASESARFGSCLEPETVFLSDARGTCVWSPDDCVDGTTYYPKWKGPPANETGCQSHRVKTGACAMPNNIGGYQYYCAVSRTSCNDPKWFLTYQEVDSNEDIAGSCYLYPEPYETPIDPLIPFKMHKNTICHPDKTVAFEQMNDEKCESKCKSSNSCKAFQVSGKKRCTLFSGTDIITTGDKFKNYKCYEKKKNKLKKKKSTLCNPRGVIGFEKGLNYKECKQKCKDSNKCNSFMTNKDYSTCFIFEKKGKSITITEKKSFKNINCYTLKNLVD